MADSTIGRMGRRVFAVVAGFVAIVILSVAVDTALEQTILPGLGHGEAGTPVWIFVTAYRAVISVFGCYLTAPLAPDRPMAHAITLGIIGVVVSTLGLLPYRRGMGPLWYPVVLIMIVLPCAWFGGLLSARPKLTI